MSFLALQDVSYRYGAQPAIIEGVSLSIEKGEFHSLLGKSGCGKTTILKLASGLLKPDSGQILFNGSEASKPSELSGFVFQAPTLLEWKTVMANILLPVSLKRKITKEDRERGESLLALMGLETYQNRFPSELSGGQQSRVAIARALILNPSMLFLDEPFAALDAITREELQGDLLQMCRLQRITVLFVTHDIGEAVYLSNRISIMEKGAIVRNLDVCLPRKRTTEMRYDSRFNEICLEVRKAISGGA